MFLLLFALVAKDRCQKFLGFHTSKKVFNKSLQLNLNCLSSSFCFIFHEKVHWWRYLSNTTSQKASKCFFYIHICGWRTPPMIPCYLGSCWISAGGIMHWLTPSPNAVHCKKGQATFACLIYHVHCLALFKYMFGTTWAAFFSQHCSGNVLEELCHMPFTQAKQCILQKKKIKLVFTM